MQRERSNCNEKNHAKGCLACLTVITLQKLCTMRIYRLSIESCKYTEVTVHELSGQNKRFWLPQGDKTSHVFLISVMSLVYGTGHHLG